MKRLILIISILCLTGCFENSGYINKTCTKKENANTLVSTTTYTYKFKNDIIDSIDVIYDYNDTDLNTISSIRTSLETQNKFSNLNYDVIDNNSNHYKIKYNIDLNNKEMLDKFKIKKSNTELVKELKQQGFNCE